MRINVYAEDLKEEVNVVEINVNDMIFYGIRFYLSAQSNTDDLNSITFWVPSEQKLKLLSKFENAIDKLIKFS